MVRRRRRKNPKIELQPNFNKDYRRTNRIQLAPINHLAPHTITQCAQCGQTAAMRVHTLSHSNTYPHSLSLKHLSRIADASLPSALNAFVRSGCGRCCQHACARFDTVHSADIDKAASALQLPPPTRPAPAPSACVTVPPAPSGSCTAGSAGARSTKSLYQCPSLLPPRARRPTFVKPMPQNRLQNTLPVRSGQGPKAQPAWDGNSSRPPLSCKPAPSGPSAG
jgi:hypothetical protein